MPLKQCNNGNKSGYKWGDSGHCYTGKDAKKKAIRQGYAIDPEKFKKEMSRKKNCTKAEWLDILTDPDLTGQEYHLYLELAELSVAERMIVEKGRDK